MCSSESTSNIFHVLALSEARFQDGRVLTMWAWSNKNSGVVRFIYLTRTARMCLDSILMDPRIERKRSSRHRSPVAVLEEPDKPREEEPLRVVLKYPRTAKRVRGGVLKECLQLETADQVLETLLQINESLYCRILDDWKQSMVWFKKLWKKHRSSVSVCSVIVHLISKLLPLATCTPHVSNSEEFVLSFARHGMVCIKCITFDSPFFTFSSS